MEIMEVKMMNFGVILNHFRLLYSFNYFSTKTSEWAFDFFIKNVPL